MSSDEKVERDGGNKALASTRTHRVTRAHDTHVHGGREMALQVKMRVGKEEIVVKVSESVALGGPV